MGLFGETEMILYKPLTQLHNYDTRTLYFHRGRARDRAVEKD